MAYEIYRSQYTGRQIDERLSDVDTLNQNVQMLSKKIDDYKPDISAETDNQLIEKTDGLYVNKTDLSNYYNKSEVDQAISDSEYTLPTATSGALGGVKPDGTTITVDSDGTIHGASSIEKVEDIGDVQLSSVTDGQALIWDATNSKWVNGTVSSSGDVEISEEDGNTITMKDDGLYSSGSIEKVEDIGDVQLSSVTNGQALIWDATNSKWVNGTVSSSGGGGSSDSEVLDLLHVEDGNLMYGLGDSDNLKGTVIYSTQYNSDGWAVKHVVNDDGGSWLTSSNDAHPYFGYQLSDYAIITKCTLSVSTVNNYNYTMPNATLQVSEDGTAWNDISDGVVVPRTVSTFEIVPNEFVKTKYVRVYFDNYLDPTPLSGNYTAFNSIHFEATSKQVAMIDDIPEGVKISEEDGNIIEEKEDGLYSTIAISSLTGNNIQMKEDGLYSSGGSGGSGEGGTTNNYYNVDSYSEEEQVIGKWINGKPVYQITVLNEDLLDFLDTHTDVDDIINTGSIKYEKYFYSTLYSEPTTFPVTSSTSTNNAKWVQEMIKFVGAVSNMSVDGSWGNGTTTALNTTLKYLGFPETGNVTKDFFDYITRMVLRPMNSENSDEKYTILEYTKTTDAENSFDPSMLPNVVIDGITKIDYSLWGSDVFWNNNTTKVSSSYKLGTNKWSMSTDKIISVAPTTIKSCNGVHTSLIDFSDINAIKISYIANDTEQFVSLDVKNVNQEAYLILSAECRTSEKANFYVYVSTSLENYGDSALASGEMGNSSITVYNVKEYSIDNDSGTGGSSSDIYAETETVIGKWIDGSDIYRQIISESILDAIPDIGKLIRNEVVVAYDEQPVKMTETLTSNTSSTNCVISTNCAYRGTSWPTSLGSDELLYKVFDGTADSTGFTQYNNSGQQLYVEYDFLKDVTISSMKAYMFRSTAGTAAYQYWSKKEGTWETLATINTIETTPKWFNVDLDDPITTSKVRVVTGPSGSNTRTVICEVEVYGMSPQRIVEYTKKED